MTANQIISRTDYNYSIHEVVMSDNQFTGLGFYTQNHRRYTIMVKPVLLGGSANPTLKLNLHTL